ncbi:rhombosortase [Cellvibrio zantedeschiae]|nr:rhombosortase [Cellvibrio zantedeschiae]
MKLFPFSARVTISLIIAGVIAVFATFPDTFFPLLSLERAKLADGEIWRLFTGNFVHFGWAHSLMNLAAFAIFVFALATSFSTPRFIALILFCCTAVGLGVYYLNPEYETYAGLSGAIHGFFVAGLLLNNRHAFWVNGLLTAALFGKIILEHQPGYQATELQSLLPVAVAYDAHLYGAIAGLIFGLGGLFIDKYLRKRHT